MINKRPSGQAFFEHGEVPVIISTLLTGVLSSAILTYPLGIFDAFVVSAAAAFGGNRLARRVFKYRRQEPNKHTLE
jgi:hypothetical protein